MSFLPIFIASSTVEAQVPRFGALLPFELVELQGFHYPALTPWAVSFPAPDKYIEVLKYISSLIPSVHKDPLVNFNSVSSLFYKYIYLLLLSAFYKENTVIRSLINWKKKDE